ncbi:MAG: ribosome biogenesis GTPase YlqF [Erysipelothrix sp.]|nr:ribosome biogenesis GTPase YlqF [Erysipelothrix sp.]
MSIQWFPGHMTKAKRAIEEQLKAVDMVIECRDARIPIASQNPLIEELTGHKPRLIILTKRDLAETKITSEWISFYQQQGVLAISLNILKDNVIAKISKGTQEAMKEKHERDLKRGIRPRMTRALIVGVPNVGKSTLINRLAKKRVVDVQNRPGVTMSLKRIKINDKLEVVDSPGLLWPRFDDQIHGIHLALCTSIKETGFPLETVTHYGFEFFMRERKETLLNYYEMNEIDDEKEFYEQIAIKVGQPINRGATLFLKDIQNHEFGPVTWEYPDEC